MIEGVSLTTGTQFTDAVVTPGAQRKAVWWMLGQVGRRMGLDVLDGLDPDTTDDRALIARMSATGNIPADALFDAGPRGVVGPEPEFGWVHDEVLPDGRFRLAPAALVERLAHEIAALDEPRPAMVLVPRRQLRSMNSARYDSEVRPEDPPWVRCSPVDVVALGLTDGDAVDVTSPHGSVRGTLRIDDRLRGGVVSLTHGWASANVSRLTSVEADVDPLTGMICQGTIPVTVIPAAVAAVPTP